MFRTLLPALSLALVASASSPDALAVRHALESRYRQARSFQAVFFERYSDGNGGGSAESGTVYFSRPDRMRWDYESPQPKLFLVDGTNVWYYVPADHVASRARIKQSTDWRTPIALLAGKLQLGEFCRSISIVDPASEPNARPLDASDSVLRCIPKSASRDPDSAIEEVLFEVEPEGYLARIIIRQPGNLQIEFRFSNWRENVEIPEIKFHFVPPAGVSIVDEQSLLSGVQ